MIGFENTRPEKGKPLPEETAIADAYISDTLYDVMPMEDGADAGSCYPL